MRASVRRPRGGLAAAVVMGLTGVLLVALTAGPAGGFSSPIVLAGCLLGAALWPLVLAAGALGPRAGRGAATAALVVVAFAVPAFVLPIVLADALPVLLEPIPAGRFNYRGTRDPGMALGTITMRGALAGHPRRRLVVRGRCVSLSHG